MGRLTVSEFQEELHALFGQRGISSERMLRWLNFAILELSGRFEFEELKVLYEFTTATGFGDYKMPRDFLGFVYVADRENKRRLRKIDQQDIALEDISTDSYSMPERWAHRNKLLWLYPIPDGEYDMEVLFTVEPKPLTEPTDVTPFPAKWDSRVLSFAQSQGHLALGETEASNSAMQRALGAMENTTTDQEDLAKTPMPGLQVAWTHEDLTESANQ